MKNYLTNSDSLLDNEIINPAWPDMKRPLGWITKIVVHHEAQFRPHSYDNTPRYEAEAQYQNNSSIPGSKGIQYHYHIDNQGTVTALRPLDLILWHCGDWEGNQHSIAICVDGHLTNQQPTREQFEALKQLLDELSTQHPEFPAVQTDVYGHRDFSATNCCGDNLYPFVTAYRNSAGNVDIPNVPYDWPEYQEQAGPGPQPEPAPLPEPPTETRPPEPKPAPQPEPETPKQERNNMEDLKARVLSRKFLLAILAAATLVLQGHTNEAVAVIVAYFAANVVESK